MVIAVVAVFSLFGFVLPNIFDIAEALVQQLGLDTSEFNTVMEAINGAVKPLLGIIATVTKCVEG